MSRVGSRSESREVGVILGVTPTGHLTARAPGPTFAPEGTRVKDAAGQLSGRIVRVFGPVERPYLSVRLKRPPRPEQGLALLGASLIRE
ncbi:MAG: H/ACA RNA-protein complex protein Gar1 [Thermoplasmata archaeon]